MANGKCPSCGKAIDEPKSNVPLADASREIKKPKCQKGFHLFPQDGREWLRVFLFPFQAYIFIGFTFYLGMSHFAGASGSELSSLASFLVLGYALCAVVLLSAGIIQAIKGFYARACVNIALAILGTHAGWTFTNYMFYRSA